jgi:hypothetical protein
MPHLTEQQIEHGYFNIIGGFPNAKRLTEVSEYNGEKQLCVACTQFNPKIVEKYMSGTKCYSNRDMKRILAEWLDFLRTNTKALKALHFNSAVPQRLFDAACCQENLEELRFKCGAYADLSAIHNLKKLKFLYIGTGIRVADITVLGKLKNLIVLYVENFKRIEGCSAFAALDNLEQFVISSLLFGRVPIKDLEFLHEMKSLASVSIGTATIKRKYTPKELTDLCATLPNISDFAVNNLRIV